MIYYVQGIKDECFVQAETPQEAGRKAKHHVDSSWEEPKVYEADWKNGVLEPKGGSPIYCSQSD